MITYFLTVICLCLCLQFVCIFQHCLFLFFLCTFRKFSFAGIFLIVQVTSNWLCSYSFNKLQTCLQQQYMGLMLEWLAKPCMACISYMVIFCIQQQVHAFLQNKYTILISLSQAQLHCIGAPPNCSLIYRVSRASIYCFSYLNASQSQTCSICVNINFVKIKPYYYLYSINKMSRVDNILHVASSQSLGMGP